ncbi:AMP-binding protein [Bifidobacterium panos]|uniref:AMP-binding enzyme n=1 Tax=Bifidobacterium panos TaxID=2675321 RepID=A0ABX1SW42_9BIFI|nr:AMP-binding protein [Bifidobacterium sp. DSM 109963]NMN01494.1 AMP-binding enzyme [Bifidobacterium sp. DSM 109963]
MSRTVLQMLEQRVMDTPKRTAVIYEPDDRITYSALWELSGRVYAWLKTRGIGAEDIVMYCLPRGIGLYACIIGTLRAGAAFVLTETDNDCKRTAYIRKDCGCKFFVDEDCWNEIIETEPINGYEPINLHNLCYIAYTSGTTGNPKGVLHEYGSLENAWKSVRMDGKPLLSEEDTFLAMSPMNFVSLPIIFSLSCAFGNAVALMPYSYHSDEERFNEYLKDAGVNCGYLTPSFLRNHYPFHQQWRMCILSSEPADGLYIDGMKCYNCYASTESGCLLTVFELPRAVTPAPVGKSQSDIELFILDEDEMETPTGEVGEICYRNPYVRGYLNLPSRTRKLLRGRIFHTGDAGALTADGDLIVRGRLDEMFKIAGYRIEPDEVANAIRSVSDLQHLVVRGFVYKDISAIVVFYTDDVEIDEVAIRERLLQILPEYMIPTNYIRLRDFPLLETGKLDKLSLLPPEGSWENLRKLSSANLPVLGKGRTATVFAFGQDKVLKLFKPSIPFAMIRQEMVLTKAAHSMGVPAPNTYELVRSGAGYGILTDKVSGTVLQEVIGAQPQERQHLISRFASAVKALHQIHVSDERVPDIREVSIALCEQLDPALYSPEDTAKIRAVFESIAPAETFVHGDCQPGNAIVKGDDTCFIDFMLCGKGDPIFDLLCMYSHYIFLPSFVSDEKCVAELGMDKVGAQALYDMFIKAYYPTLSDAQIVSVEERIERVHAARICLASVVLPGVFPVDVLQKAKDKVVRF